MLISLRSKQYHCSFISLILVILVVSLCLYLAAWQLQRAENKQQRLDYIEAMKNKGEFSWAKLNYLPATFNKTGLQLKTKGKFNTHKYWLLDNRTLNGRPGYDVITIFYPSNSSQALLVNFGWIAQGESRNNLPTIQLPNHEIAINVQLKQGDLAGFYLNGAQLSVQGWPKLIQFIDIKMQTKQSTQQLVDFIAYAIDKNPYAQPHYQNVVMPPEKHHAYALQWLLIGIAALGIFIFAVRSQNNNQTKSSDFNTQIPTGEVNDK
ncbi:transmembrane cytochrome oxidase complex biogenesis factor [Pseudoalteromonas sp. NBT06-2]|uniref:SURF1 family protein n=1 Tax=Pseudoalteromonas sp. NBT06-2 TaxID=2025950 RepID=UPI000BA760D7|nr:SURF1 family protein [Pseudoalteromonas sp. NBT06-2]PAJ73818.1 transmembrane cytochrome oxidase complex biogenesis factor [Pseudoalteromonas sp. NBT06-2]